MNAPLVHRATDEVTAREAARVLGISHTKMNSLIHKSLVPARAVGRVYVVRVADLEAFRAQYPELVHSAA
jgi:excisionase family DNA binding protein